MSSDPAITTERQGHVLQIGLNRPSKRNAFSVAMYEDLGRAYALLDRDDDLRCGLLFAHGDHFTGGIDLAEFASTFATGQLPVPSDGLDPVGIVGSRVSKPIVVAVQGTCLTIGIELMLAADIRVAAADTRFGQIEVQRGIYPVGGATLRFARECGWGNAMRWLLTGDAFDAAEALRIGLVQEVVPSGQSLQRAMAIAQGIAEQAPLGVRATLASARLEVREGEAAAAERLIPDLIPIMGSEDVREGIASFLERRKARFKGR